MKKCPYCAEEIQEEAIKCKHCGESFNNIKPIRCGSCSKMVLPQSTLINGKKSLICPSCGKKMGNAIMELVQRINFTLSNKVIFIIVGDFIAILILFFLLLKRQ